MNNKLYPTDVTDRQWDVIKELLPVSCTGRPRQLEMRQILNGLLYVVVGGIKWRMLPHEYPKMNIPSGRVFTTISAAGVTWGYGNAFTTPCEPCCGKNWDDISIPISIPQPVAWTRSWTRRALRPPRLVERAARTGASKSKVANAMFWWIRWAVS